MQTRLSTARRGMLAAAALFAIAATLGFAAPQKEVAKPANTGTAVAPLVDARGVLVAGVQSGSPADTAGIARGDIITEAEGKAVDTPPALAAVIGAKKPGDSLALKLRHGDAQKTVTVTLGTQAGRVWLGIEAEAGRAGFGRMPGNGRFGYGVPGNGRFGMMLSGSGAYVAAVTAGSPAEKAGLVKGDVILSVDGTAVDAGHPLGDLIAAKKVGDTVTLSVQSAPQQGAQPGDQPGARQPAAPAAHDVKVTLGKNPDKDAAWLGIQYSLVGPRASGMMPGFGGGRGIAVAGVFIADVAAGSPADKAGIKVHDVITKVDGTAVTDPQQVVDAVAKHKPGDGIPVTVTRAADGSSADVSVVLGASPNDAAKAYMGVSMSAGQWMRPNAPRAGGSGSDSDGTDGNAGSTGTPNSPTL